MKNQLEPEYGAESSTPANDLEDHSFASLPKAVTPMMRQYLMVKQQHKDYMLFYRMGDFYELFFEDAIIAAEVLDITLTKRGKHLEEDIPMCGVPAHSAEPYLEKLIASGHRVAICEQVESPEEAKRRGGYKAVVKREVVRIVTPGTLIEEALLEGKQANYLLSIAHINDQISLAWSDISTGVFFVSTSTTATLSADLARLSPGEILVPRKLLEQHKIRESLSDWMPKTAPQPDSMFDTGRGEHRLCTFYNLQSLAGIGDFTKSEIAACGALLEYLEHTQKIHLPRLARPKRLKASNFMLIDASTRRNLEINISTSGERKNSLLAVMDKTITATGGRLLSLYLSSPLCNSEAINHRLDAVEFFTNNKDIREQTRTTLRSFPDIERALSRIFLSKGSPKDLVSIADGLIIALNVCDALTNLSAHLPKILRTAIGQMGNFGSLLTELRTALPREARMTLKEGGFINQGYNPQLDRLRDLQAHSTDKLLELQEKYRRLTGVSSLKITNNNVLGYFVEVKPSYSNKITDPIFEHRQTLGNAVRYTTPELRQMESELINCNERISQIELEIFASLCNKVMDQAEAISMTAQGVASIDLFSSLAQLAIDSKYARPNVDSSLEFHIEGGRHPVVERANRSEFIANGCNLNPGNNVWLITGPNMAGKSTFLRQNALICIMAQIGSFVPATSAHIGIVDKLFSRIGAADDISRGQSTFMVEMVETANILNNATPRSLIILDEIGRGTSTYDGVSIAWAVVEYIHNNIGNIPETKGCRTLFATHYHELTQLEDKLTGVVCYTMKVREWEGKVIFLHEVEKGRADRSYGIHVAELAGLPKAVTARAQEILKTLED
jgi:DNA mismatch repair protein MutS